tara:strand:- start:104 stop:997 length:894 start_codon:yes stop_codon:yes gene_type:complete
LVSLSSLLNGRVLSYALPHLLLLFYIVFPLLLLLRLIFFCCCIFAFFLVVVVIVFSTALLSDQVQGDLDEINNAVAATAAGADAMAAEKESGGAFKMEGRSFQAAAAAAAVMDSEAAAAADEGVAAAVAAAAVKAAADAAAVKEAVQVAARRAREAADQAQADAAAAAAAAVALAKKENERKKEMKALELQTKEAERADVTTRFAGEPSASPGCSNALSILQNCAAVLGDRDALADMVVSLIRGDRGCERGRKAVAFRSRLDDSQWQSRLRQPRMKREVRTLDGERRIFFYMFSSIV